MSEQEILNHWDASVYEQQENYAHDVKLLAGLMPTPRRILDVACGAGRMTLPLARAGHTVHGFDLNPHMLSRLQAHLADGSYPTVTAELLDGAQCAWPQGFDVALLGANLLLNLVCPGADYAAVQRLFLQRAADALVPGGHLWLDFDCVDWPSHGWDDSEPWVCFDGTDEWGTYGQYIVGRSAYDADARMYSGESIWKLTPRCGAPFTVTRASVKHFPSWREVQTWLAAAGFIVERLYCDSIAASEGRDGCRITVWARKPIN